MRTFLALALLCIAPNLHAQAISGLTELAAAPANGDLIEIVDVSDTSMSANGTNKKITTANLMSYLATADAGGDTTTFCMLATAATGTLAPATDAGCSYDADTNTLTVSGEVSTATVTSSTRVLLASGSAGSPGVAFTADNDGSASGWYRSAADTWMWNAGGGANVLSISSAGITLQSASGTIVGAGGTLRGMLHSVEAVTTTKTPAIGECGELYTNTGDTDGATITLTNDPTAGCCYKAHVTAAQTLTLVFNTGESLYMGSDQCVASMTASAVGSNTEVCAAVGGSGGQWHALASAGWTCND